MDSKVLAIIGAAGVAFLFSKGSKKSSVSKPKVSLSPKDIERGYQITGCSKVVIFDVDVALEYAYQQGQKHSPDKWDEVIFDNCIKPLTQGIADFKFNMSKAAATGAFDMGNYDEGKLLQLLQSIKDEAELNNLNTSKWIVEIIKKK